MVRKILRRKKRATARLALNTIDAAKKLGCSESLLRKMRQNGDGPAYVKMGTKVVYPIPELKRYLEKNIVN